MNFNQFLDRIDDINLSFNQKERLFSIMNDIVNESGNKDDYVTKADIADIINNQQFIANIANNLMFVKITVYFYNKSINHISPSTDYIRLSYDISYMNNNKYYNHHKDDTVFYITNIPENLNVQGDDIPSYLNICPDYHLFSGDFNKKTIILDLTVEARKYIMQSTARKLVDYGFNGTNSIITKTDSEYSYASYNVETSEYEKIGWIVNNYFYIIDDIYNADKKICHIIINNEHILLYNFNNYLKHN